MEKTPTDKDSLFEIRKRAEGVVDLIETMNKTFPNAEWENSVLVVMACIIDAYNAGQKSIDSCRTIKDI